MKHQLKTVSCLMVVAGSTVAMAQPANDNVNSAMPIGFPLPAMAGTTVGATNQGNIPTLTNCGNSTTVTGVQALINSDIQGSRDVWYILTTPGTLVANTSLAASTCGPNTMSDTVVEVYNVAAGGTLGTRITCDDDTCLNRKSRATFTAQPNTQYLIRVATRNNSQAAFELNVLFGTDPRPIDTVQSNGPDVTVGDLSDVYHWGTATLDGVPVRAFSVGTDSWNIGDKPGNWFDYNTTITFRPIGAPAGTTITRPRVSNQHPVIAQQMYRLRNGNFEQIGISWLKHGFTSLNSSSFNQGLPVPSNTSRTCPGSGGFTSAQSVTGAAGGDFLVVNCSDLYGGSLNGSHTYLGPRFDVNALNGNYTHPFTPLVPPVENNTISRRLIVAESDWNNPGARYFVDAVYVTDDDNKWNNALNNYSAREVRPLINGTSVAWMNTNTPRGAGTMRRRPAIHFWPEIDPGVKMVNVDFHEQTVTFEDQWNWPTISRTVDLTGRFIVASRVTDNGDGTWTYRYAVMNVNSHRGADAFVVKMPGTATATNIQTQAPLYHSGDRVDNTPWTAVKSGNFMRFDTNMNFVAQKTLPTVGTVTFAPNALRWGVMHNYRFTTTVPPTTGTARLKLDRAPTDATGFQGELLTISGIDVPQVALADIAGANQSVGGDGSLTADDIIVFLGAYFAGDLLTADVAGANQSPVPDGSLTADDIIVFLNAYFGG